MRACVRACVRACERALGGGWVRACVPPQADKEIAGTHSLPSCCCCVCPTEADKEIAGKLELLKGISLYARPGSLTALMGGSGAGKVRACLPPRPPPPPPPLVAPPPHPPAQTTLMDCILGRKTVGLVRGEILVNGRPKEQATWGRVAGYVEQQDLHSAGTTVGEALWFSARLRTEESVGDAKVRGVGGRGGGGASRGARVRHRPSHPAHASPTPSSLPPRHCR